MVIKSFPYYSQLTFEREGGKLPAVLRPHCPGNSSGVTIGPGYDMREREPKAIIADLEAAGVPNDVATKLSGGAGKQGDAAKTWIAENYPSKAPVITAEASSNLFTHVYPKYATLVRNKVSELWEADWDALPVNMREVLVDLAFRGDLNRFKDAATKHEKLIKPLVVQNDYVGFRELINDFRYWQDNTNLPDSRSGAPNGRITARGRWLDGPLPPRASAVHFPLDLGEGTSPGDQSTKTYYAHTEVDHRGGYFPIGANTVWHGGVHLHVERGTYVHALWDGKIVAARLSDDRSKAEGHYGSFSFVLVRHELPGAQLNKLRPKGKLIGYKVRVDAIRFRAAASLAGKHLATLAAQDELDLLEPEFSEADGYRWAHVKVHRSADAGLVGQQGYVAIKSHWYWARREAIESPSLDERKTYPLFALYMHLGLEPLDDDSDNLAEIAWIRVPSNVSNESLKNAVGLECSNISADVKKVQTRLEVHGHYAGPIHGQCDEATLSAINSFQKTLVESGALHKVDQVIGAKGKTWKSLQQAPREPQLDAELAAELRKGKVVALDKPVRGGDALWTSGDYGSSKYRTGLLHWELFSADNLVPGWTSVVDDDEDFNLDNKKIISLVDQDSGFWASDEVLTSDEIARFYRAQGKSKQLRMYACKFISEWGIDLDIAIPKMLDTGLFSSFGLAGRMSPYLWWSEAVAAGVDLPPSPKCWHYNPIAFTSELARVMPHRGAGALAHRDTVTINDDHTYVIRGGKKVPHYSQGDSKWGKRILGSKATISQKGCAITSVAMILSYYGRDVTPEIIDQYLDDEDGYSGDMVKWAVAFKCAETSDLKFGGYKTIKTGMTKVLDERIATNKPTLARVDYKSDVGEVYNHFVVVVGRHKDGHYIMNDPATIKGNGASNPTDENLIEKTSRKQGYTLVQVDIFDPQ